MSLSMALFPGIRNLPCESVGGAEGRGEGSGILAINIYPQNV